MSYQTFYRKYRSQTFADLVGQGAVSRALQGAVIGGRVAHAYLFSGTRGTGKTSSARLLAKSLNCTARQAGSAEPCNACESCLSITAGAALDLIEIDAASNRGIDEIRDLREKVNLAPALGGKKIYIIDEAHMLTTEAFNALLKTLEEPPDHVIFILCTTEAQKIPATVLGRCQQFVFRRLTEEQIASRLRMIAGREGLTADEEVLSLIARTAQGSMRDAVGLLDQVVPLADGNIDLSSARELLQIADPEQVSHLLDAVIEGRARDALGQLDRIYEAGGEYRSVVRGLMERTRDLLIAAIERRDGAARRRLSDALDALVHLDGEVRRHGEPRFLIEATLVRLAVEGTPGVAPAVPSGPAPTAPPVAVAPAPPVAVAPAPPASAQAAPRSPEPAAAEAPEPAAPPRLEEVTLVVAEAAPEVAVTAAAPGSDLPAGWSELLQQLKPTVKAFFREAQPEWDGATLTLWFRYSLHQHGAEQKKDDFAPLAAAWLGTEPSLDFRLREAAASAVAAPAARPAAPEEDPLVQAAVRALEGRVTRVRED